jgi:hypothetical protein
MSGEDARRTRARNTARWPLHHAFGPSLPRRSTDRAEDLAAWLLVSLGLLAALGAVLVGHSTYGAALDRGGIGGAAPVRAVLLADAVPGPSPADQRAPALRQVPVVWTSADGVEHTDELAVRPPARAGTEVAAWLDRDGRVVASPSGRPAEAVAFGMGAGLTTAALAWALLAMAWCGVRRITGRRNAGAWAREWSRVEPVWSRRVR